MTPTPLAWLLPVLVGLGTAGCGVQPVATSDAPAAPAAATQLDISRYSFQLTTARKVERGKGASDITRSFDFEGQIFAFAAITWPPGSAPVSPEIGIRWYNDKGLVSEQKRNVALDRPPHYVYFATTGLAMGACGCRADLVANGKVVASQPFAVNPR